MDIYCPCCAGSRSIDDIYSAPYHRCLGCGHCWCAAEMLPTVDYGKLRERNIIDSASHLRKLRERMSDISPLLRPGIRILEIGCAEGSLGTLVRNAASVHYTGIELSADAATAACVLDRVIKAPAAALADETFDLLLSFHVLEHIENVAAELGHWRRLLATSGQLLFEVPHRSGHPLLSLDVNPEHRHQFTPASLVALLYHAGFEIERLDSGHWESPVYSDSLRVLAHPSLSAAQRRQLLLQRFITHLAGPFAAWGIGGDFRGYVEPLLDSLPVVALIDNDPRRHGERHGYLAVERFNPVSHGDLPILVCSVRYREAILGDLATLGIPRSRITTLDEIFGGDIGDA